jgi:hypothetical protein
MELLMIGVVTAFNFLILKWKFDHSRYADLVLDIVILGVLAFLFGGTITGMIVAMIAGGLVSLYLLISPPKFKSTVLRPV